MAVLLNGSTIHVTWGEVPSGEQHGAVTSYTIMFKSLYNSSTLQEACSSYGAFQTTDVNGTTRSWSTPHNGNIGLVVKIAASTSAGVGPYSECAMIPYTMTSSASVTGAVAGGVVGGVVLILVALVVVIVLMRRRVDRRVFGFMGDVQVYNTNPLLGLFLH